MEWPQQLLFHCTTQDTREVFASLVVSVIGNLIGAGERGLYREMEEQDEVVDMEDLDEDGEVIMRQDEEKRIIFIAFLPFFVTNYNFYYIGGRGTQDVRVQ